MGQKTGRILRSGYWYRKLWDHPMSGKQGYVAEHRLVLEKEIGRYLTPGEVVHHVNGDRQDNRLENLELFPSHGLHTKHVHLDAVRKGAESRKGIHPPNYGRVPHCCGACGVEFLANPKRHRRFCSRLCKGIGSRGIPNPNPIGLQFGRGWNKGLPMTWQRRGMDSPSYKHGKYSKYAPARPLQD